MAEAAHVRGGCGGPRGGEVSACNPVVCNPAVCNPAASTPVVRNPAACGEVPSEEGITARR